MGGEPALYEAVNKVSRIPSPRYLEIAQCLQQEIEAGVHPVGGLLPTETELCQTFGVSRHTVREALRLLREQGFVTRRQGSGTQVIARDVAPAFRQSLASIGDLHQYAVSTHLVLGPGATVTAKGGLAALLDCAPSRQWKKYAGVRRADNGDPICLTEVYIDPALSAVDAQFQKRPGAIYQLIEEMFGKEVVEVRQEISAVILDAQAAETLGVEPGSAALQIVRRYLDQGNRPFEVAVSLHPTDHFTYTMRIRRESSS